MYYPSLYNSYWNLKIINNQSIQNIYDIWWNIHTIIIMIRNGQYIQDKCEILWLVSFQAKIKLLLKSYIN